MTLSEAKEAIRALGRNGFSNLIDPLDKNFRFYMGLIVARKIAIIHKLKTDADFRSNNEFLAFKDTPCYAEETENHELIGWRGGFWGCSCAKLYAERYGYKAELCKTCFPEVS